MVGRHLRDSDISTCIEVPTHGSEMGYLKAMMSWSVYDTPYSNYNVSVKGVDLLCEENNMIVYMKTVITWSNPSFLRKMKLCHINKYK